MSKVIVLPVRVQGVEAPPEIVGAIRYANKYEIADLIITGRGGGSIEDLWAFNDERVARAIYESEIPVISAVGHEPDVTIADYVADLRAATPSNGAELAVPDCQELSDVINSYSVRANQGMRKKLSELSSRLSDLSSRRVLVNPGEYIDRRRQELDSDCAAIQAAFERQLALKNHNFIRLGASLDALSPLRVLGRGYSIASDESGKTISDAQSVKPGDCIKLRLAKGSLQCTVDNTDISGL